MPNNFVEQHTNIAIVGGGFGGVEVFKELQDLLKPQVKITLFNDRTDFIFTPLLHEAATGGVNLTNIAAPLRSFVKHKNAQFVHACVEQIDLNSKNLTTKYSKYSYDYLIVATGSKSNTKNVHGADQYCHFLKSIDDAIKLRKSILETLEVYSQTQNPKLAKFVIIGGGSTGVELALEIDDYVRYTLHKYYAHVNLLKDFEVSIICPSQYVLTGLHKSIQSEAMSRLNKANIKLKMQSLVTRVDEDVVVTDKNEKIDASVIVWCGGVTVSMPSLIGQVTTKTLNTLNLADHNNVFLLGDCVNYGTLVPMDAQSAVKQAKVVALNIFASMHSKPLKEFEYVSSGTLVSLGRWHAAGKLGPFFLKGHLAWWVWRTIYLFKFPLRSKRLKIAIDWTVAVFSGRDISNV